MKLKIAGKKFGRLLVLEEHKERGKNGDILWKCVCDCGEEVIVRGWCMKTGVTVSCGCYKRERSSEVHMEHGLTGSPTYASWQNMKDRCSNPNNKAYGNYGGRGMSKVVLYAKQSDKLRKWECFADGAEVVVIHGQVGGKQTEKRYTAEAKNQGRSNATTPESQALLEVEAKVVKQLKSGYFYTEEEAMSFEPFEPLKAQPFTDFAHKVKYPCVVQAKFNGQRLMIDKNGNAWSKQGEPLSLPAHWKGIRELAIQTQGLDGEIYAGLESEGGLSLQDIISAFRKPNANTPKLQYWVYDVPLKGVTFRERFDRLHELVGAVFDKDISYIQVVPGIVVDTAEQADSLFEYNVGEGYEGLMYRNLGGLYEFGKRSYDLIKRKTFIDFEAKVLSVAKDKNDCGVLLCEAVNGKGVGTQFKVLMRKDADAVNYRLYDNAITLVGKHIVVEGDEFSDDNIVTKPRGIALREVINGEGRF